MFVGIAVVYMAGVIYMALLMAFLAMVVANANMVYGNAVIALVVVVGGEIVDAKVAVVEIDAIVNVDVDVDAMVVAVVDIF